MSQLAQDSVVTIIARVMALGIAMLNSVVIARHLGPTLQGSYNIVLLTLNTSTMIFLLGLGSANIFIGARHQERLPTMLGNSLLAGSGLGLVAVLLIEFLITWPPLQEYFASNGVPLTIVRPLVLMIPGLLIYNFVREIIRAQGHMVLYNLLAFLQVTINFVVLVLLISWQSDKMMSAILAWIAAQIAVTLLTVLLALHSVQFQVGADWMVFKGSLSFGLRNHGGVIAQFLNYRLDVFLIGLFLTPTAIGYYAIATNLAERIWEFPTAIRTSLIYHVSATENNAALTTSRVTRVVSVIIGVICITLILLADPLIRLLYGAAYLSAVPALVLLIPGIWAFSIGKLMAVYLASVNHPEIGTLTGVVALVVTVVLDVILIPTLGIAGAAIASSISYGLSAIIIMAFFLRMTGLSIADVLITQRSDLRFMRQLFMGIARRLVLIKGNR